MEHKDVFLLEVMADYCERTASYLAQNRVTEAEFLKNPFHQDICSFYCLQIGENANLLSERYREAHPEVEWRKIIGLRHLIAHEYGSIDPGILWGIVTKNVPELRRFCVEQVGV